jgi:hypothetical protein
MMPGMKRAVLVMERAEIVWAGVRLAAQPFLNGLSDARTTLAAFGLLHCRRSKSIFASRTQPLAVPLKPESPGELGFAVVAA